VGGEKNLGQIYGNSCKCTPRQSKSPFLRKLGEIWALGVVNLVLLAFVLRAKTKKGVNFFFLGGGEKCIPRENPGYASASSAAYKTPD